MTFSRRSFLARSALAGLGAAAFGVPTPAAPSPTAATPWRNWSGHLAATPAGRFSPRNEDELARVLGETSGAFRPVGAGHSFSALVPTDGHLIVLDRLAGLIEHDAAMMTATFGAGTRLSEIGAPLDAIGQAMSNLPDIDRQTLAGATATATHGTGIDFPCLSAFLTGMRLVTATGQVLDLDETDERFGAAQVSLGALGVVTRMTLRNRTPFRLKVRNWAQPIEDVLASFDASAAEHRHFEMFPLTHSNYALVLAIDETDEPIDNPPPSPEESAGFAAAMAAWAAMPPRERLPMIDGLAAQIEPSSAVDVSYKILSNIRNDRFNEMEYSVPVAAGADCLREVLAAIIDNEVDVVFPLEYRYVRRDDTWIGMSAGDEDHAAISIHRTAGADFRPYFDLIEPIFWKYGGRPHWGKVHSLGASQLRELYPRFDDFSALRRELDPDGRLLNPHLAKIFGEGV